MLRFDAAANRAREQLELAATQLAVGNPAWQTAFAGAVQAANSCTDEASRDDAAIRIHQFAHHLDLNGGDSETALARLNEALLLIERQRQRGDDTTRNNDHRWSALTARCRVHQVRGDLDSAATDAAAALQLAPETCEPEHRTAAGMLSLGAIEMLRGNYADSVQHYRRAVDASRAVPSLLPESVLGLAQAQARLGQLDEASLSLDRFEALLANAGENIDLRAKLLQLRSFIANAQQRRVGSRLAPAAASSQTARDAHREYSDHVARFGAHLEQAHRSAAAAARGMAYHSETDLRAARREAEQALQQSAAAGDQPGQAYALMQLAVIQQDTARFTGDKRHHDAALARLEQASELAVRINQPLYAAGLDTEHARYITQWHGTNNYLELPLLSAALRRATRAAVYLHLRSFDGSLASERRSYAAQYAADAFEVAAQLAFGTGNKRLVAELVELRASGAVFSSGIVMPTTPNAAELLATEPPPLLFAPGEVALASALADASATYGMSTDERAPIPTW